MDRKGVGGGQRLIIWEEGAFFQNVARKKGDISTPAGKIFRKSEGRWPKKPWSRNLFSVKQPLFERGKEKKVTSWGKKKKESTDHGGRGKKKKEGEQSLSKKKKEKRGGKGD